MLVNQISCHDRDERPVHGFRPTIGIIGLGPAGVCMLHAFGNMAQSYSGARFVLFDPDQEPFGGASHASYCESFRVNMRVELHSLKGFVSFPDFCDSLHWPAAELPVRWILSEYLRFVYHTARTRLQLAGASIEVVHASATSLVRMQQRYGIRAGGREFLCDYVILATGNPPPRRPRVDRWHGGESSSDRLSVYTGSPGFARDIRPGNRILVIGTGPGGLDVARYCVENIPTPYPVDMVSRTGLLSKVQTLHPAPETFDNEILRIVSKFEEKRPVALTDMCASLLPWFHRADPAFDLSTLLNRPTDPVETLRRDIAEARENFPRYRTVVDSIGRYAPRLWKCLSASGQQEFFKRFDRTFYVVRHAMPIQAGEWLVKAASTGRIRVGRISAAVPLQETRRGLTAHVAFGSSEPLPSHYDRVVVATGPDWNLKRSRSTLIRQILKDGIGIADDAGGFLTHNFELVGRPNVFAVGAGLRGEYLSVHAVPALEFHAHSNEATIRKRMMRTLECRPQKEVGR